MKFKLKMILILLLFWQAGDVPAYAGVGVKEFDFNLYIFSVGINQYQDKILAPLTAAENDAVVLADEFERRGKDGYGKVHKTVLLGSQAKKADILREFDRLSREISSKDTFIFNFAGMGSDELKIRADEFYLFPNDFRLQQYAETGISNTQLQALFRKIRAARKLVILDACKSASGYESAVNSFVEQDKRVADLNGEDVLFIGTDTLSFERRETNHGSLTEIILNGLNGKADFDSNGTVSARELEAFVYKDAISYSILAKFDFHPRTVTRGGNFAVGFTDREIEKIAKSKLKDSKSERKDSENEIVVPRKETSARNEAGAQTESSTQTGTRSEVIYLDGKSSEKNPEWRGNSYAVLFANDTFDNAGWRKLKNPQNDARDVAKALKENYGFKQVIIKTNPTTQEIYDTVEEFQKLNPKEFNREEDQLFFFFAGHGFADKYNKGFYVGKDSPYPLTRQNESQFVSLDGILNAIDRIPLEYIMVVFDTCYAGQIWKPSIQLEKDIGRIETKSDDSGLAGLSVSPVPRFVGASNVLSKFAENDFNYFQQTDLTKLAYAKRKMKSRSRRVLTSGYEPVLDSWIKKDGTRSSNSPFADAFLQALRSGGGDFGVLTTAEIVTFIDKLPTEPQVGKLSGTDGDFVFVKADKQPPTKSETR